MAKIQQKADTVDRKLAALELRKQGMGFWDIAQKLGYKSSSGAYAAVVTALCEVLREPAEEVRALEIERLDKMITHLMPYIDRPDAKSSWDIKFSAMDRVIKLMDRRAKYLGLD